MDKSEKIENANSQTFFSNSFVNCPMKDARIICFILNRDNLLSVELEEVEMSLIYVERIKLKARIIG